MTIPEKFDAIRPFNPEELPQAYDRLLADPQFQQVLAYLYPGIPLETLREQMYLCPTLLDFQKAFAYKFIKKIMAEISDGFTLDAGHLDIEKRYTFISNHRDIVLDPGLLDVLLIDAGFQTTCEIAIGDNLLTRPWVKDLVRLNKSFIVQRSLPMRQLLEASRILSEYMHFAIAQKKENIWIAQREGRAKDSDDRTAEGVLKMMAMAGDGTPTQRLMQLHLVPVAISYEYDPCDFLKAKEFQQRRDNPQFKKSAEDDILSMRTGMMGRKGRVHYQAASCIDDYLASLPVTMSKTELYKHIAVHIDREIHARYRLYPNNYAALDLLNGTSEHASCYTTQQLEAFEQYIDRQIARIDLPNKDEPYLRERILTMYANIAINYLKAHE